MVHTICFRLYHVTDMVIKRAAITFRAMFFQYRLQINSIKERVSQKSPKHCSRIKGYEPKSQRKVPVNVQKQSVLRTQYLDVPKVNILFHQTLQKKKQKNWQFFFTELRKVKRVIYFSYTYRKKIVDCNSKSSLFL